MDFDLNKALTILIPTLGGWGAAWLTNRRERRQWLEKQEAEQNQQLQQQSERLAAGWSEMTAQAREIITRLQTETIDAKTRAAIAEDRARDLERELADIRARYGSALAELEALKDRRKRPRRPDQAEPKPEPQP